MSEEKQNKPFGKDDIEDLFDIVEQELDLPEEEVVLSSDDESVTPTAVALHKDEFEKTNGGKGKALKVAEDKAVETVRRTGVFNVLLALLRVPENFVKTLFRATPFYRLLRRSIKYREFERDNAISETLLTKSDRKASRAGKFSRFVVNNVLVTCTLAAIIVFGVNISFKSLMEINAVRSVVGLDKIDDGSVTMAEARQTRFQARITNMRRENVVEDLDHCAITDAARDKILTAIGTDGKVDSIESRRSLSALKRFKDTYATQRLDRSINIARTRRALISAMVKPEVTALDTLVQQILQKRSIIQRKAQGLRQELSALESRSPKAAKKSVNDINERIHIRDDLVALNSELHEGPTKEDIELFSSSMQQLKDALVNNMAQPLELPEPDDFQTPEWIHRIDTMSDADIRESMLFITEERLQYGEDKLREGSWPVIAYYFIGV